MLPYVQTIDLRRSSTTLRLRWMYLNHQRKLFELQPSTFRTNSLRFDFCNMDIRLMSHADFEVFGVYHAAQSSYRSSEVKLDLVPSICFLWNIVFA